MTLEISLKNIFGAIFVVFLLPQLYNFFRFMKTNNCEDTTGKFVFFQNLSFVTSLNTYTINDIQIWNWNEFVSFLEFKNGLKDVRLVNLDIVACGGYDDPCVVARKDKELQVKVRWRDPKAGLLGLKIKDFRCPVLSKRTSNNYLVWIGFQVENLNHFQIL